MYEITTPRYIRRPTSADPTQMPNTAPQFIAYPLSVFTESHTHPDPQSQTCCLTPHYTFISAYNCGKKNFPAGHRVLEVPHTP